ncbi:2-oxoglutarate and iron-dependent oxygenase JMJD4 homolog [Teleopsis dalmanni]|uniref:2-oxoglutarate and iron-dependent oxygenase JMJD4 homolog n=1 Tax=Teleopsis dalmanni TaxID=139649 RepID=UPI0018CEE585|nr:2-oxoglutarate and iron-dependent oxygenase JMJD4 homolog [Teleopsis dalmanni]
MATAELLQLLPVASCQKNDNSKIKTIPRHAEAQINYNDFYWNYMDANCPVVLTGVSENWECRKKWTFSSNKNSAPTSNENNTTYTAINFDYLKDKLSDCRVPVADCSREYFNSHVKKEMQFCEFLDYWQAQVNAYSSTVNKINDNPSNLKTTDNLYLKDWHLKAQLADYNFYTVPKHFASDWLNEYLIINGKDDYRFVYMGPKGSWTPFHADVFGSYSWSTNIAGCKKWLMLPPNEELKLADRFGNLPFCIDEQILKENNVVFYTVMQEENEALFVPSGWYHQVCNLTDTISINHNWFNACNVQRIWRNLTTNMKQVIQEIADCRQMDNFDEHCQTMLRASFGINYLDFLDIIEFIAERRLSSNSNGNNCNVATEKSSNFVIFDTFTLNEFHIRNDLECLWKLLEIMIQDKVICDSRNLLYRRCLRLLELMKGF